MLKEIIPIYALIPARGDSVGIPRNNLALLAGKQLIDHTKVAAKKSLLIDEVWVSSDKEEISNYSIRYGV